MEDQEKPKKKPLVSDEEVIKALFKESRRREGKLPSEATRIRPNLNFLQRTVTNVVSTNTRIASRQLSFMADHTREHYIPYRISEKLPPKSKKSVYRPQRKNFEREKKMFPKINFVKADEQFKCIPDPKNKFKEKYQTSFVKSSEILYTTTNTKANDKINTIKRDHLFNHFVKSEILYSTTTSNPNVSITNSLPEHPMLTQNVGERTFVNSITSGLADTSSLEIKSGEDSHDHGISKMECDYPLSLNIKSKVRLDEGQNPSNSVIIIDSETSEESYNKRKQNKKKKQKHKKKRSKKKHKMKTDKGGKNLST